MLKYESAELIKESDRDDESAIIKHTGVDNMLCSFDTLVISQIAIPCFLAPNSSTEARSTESSKFIDVLRVHYQDRESELLDAPFYSAVLYEIIIPAMKNEFASSLSIQQFENLYLRLKGENPSDTTVDSVKEFQAVFVACLNEQPLLTNLLTVIEFMFLKYYNTANDVVHTEEKLGKKHFDMLRKVLLDYVKNYYRLIHDLEQSEDVPDKAALEFVELTSTMGSRLWLFLSYLLNEQYNLEIYNIRIINYFFLKYAISLLPVRSYLNSNPCTHRDRFMLVVKSLPTNKYLRKGEELHFDFFLPGSGAGAGAGAGAGVRESIATTVSSSVTEINFSKAEDFIIFIQNYNLDVITKSLTALSYDVCSALAVKLTFEGKILLVQLLEDLKILERERRLNKGDAGTLLETTLSKLHYSISILYDSYRSLPDRPKGEGLLVSSLLEQSHSFPYYVLNDDWYRAVLSKDKNKIAELLYNKIELESTLDANFLYVLNIYLFKTQQFDYQGIAVWLSSLKLYALLVRNFSMSFEVERPEVISESFSLESNSIEKFRDAALVLCAYHEFCTKKSFYMVLSDSLFDNLLKDDFSVLSLFEIDDVRHALSEEHLKGFLFYLHDKKIIDLTDPESKQQFLVMYPEEIFNKRLVKELTVFCGLSPEPSVSSSLSGNPSQLEDSSMSLVLSKRR